MTTLEAQRLRLEQEIREAVEQINMIKQQPCPDFKILNYYTDVVVRDQQLIDMIDCHLFGSQQAHASH